MKNPTELAELYREQGLKITPQRQCIFGLLDGNTTHPSADSIFEAARGNMPTISRKTVYTILHELTELGEIATIDVGTRSLRFDPDVHRHHHLVCSKCGWIGDVHGVDTAALRIPKGQRRRFDIEDTEIVFRGTCEKCRSKGG